MQLVRCYCKINLEIGRMYSELVGVKSAEIAEVGGELGSADVPGAFSYGPHYTLPNGAQRLRARAEVQMCEIRLSLRKCRKHPGDKKKTKEIQRDPDSMNSIIRNFVLNV